VLGIDGVHSLRRGEVLGALGRAYEAVHALDQVLELAPDFVDARLGQGMYLYWRAVAATLSPLVPRFEDRRAEGIATMLLVEREGVLLGPATTLALTYAYAEERRPELALAASRWLSKQYPDNLLALTTTGRLLLALDRPTDSLPLWQRLLKVAPDNQRAHYYLGCAAALAGDLAGAEQEWRTYLGFAEVAPFYRAQALHRLGLVQERQGDLAAARASWTEAVRVDDNPDARRALARTETR
jgi:tetratricopeptide (TPR) repeat protein